MADGLDADAYDTLVTAAETYRAALVVRLAGEAGLRTGEITRVAPRHLQESESVSGTFLLAVPDAGATANTKGDTESGDAGDGDDGGDGDVAGVDERSESVDRETTEHESVGRESIDRKSIDSEPIDSESIDSEPIDRKTIVPESLAAELRRYAESADLDEADPFIDVSARRVQMIVSETAERAADRSDGTVAGNVTPRDLRHTFARRLLVDRGVDPHAVREAGGWETMGTLDTYLGSLDGEAIADAFADDLSSIDPAAPTGTQESAALAGFEAIAHAGGDEAGSDDSEPPLTAVPEQLVDAERWAEAWVVRGWVDGGRAEVVGASGVDREVLVDRGVTSDGPWREAIDDGKPVTVDAHPATAGRPALAVPIRYRDVTHGVLCVVAADTAVSDVERRELSALGRCLGWAATAGRWRDLLHSDAVTEVEFRTADDEAFLARASATLGCRIELESTVSVAADASRFYLSVTGARPQAIADVVDGASGISDLRVIETREDGCSVSTRVEGGSVVRALTEHGATVRDAAAEKGEVRVVADLPEGADVRPVASGLRAAFPDARLASKESVTRSPRTESSLREGVEDRFTDRQWAALSAAYHGGYFDWPRGSTAEEVADAMDVSSPTFHNHLRKAQRVLLDGLFEDERRREHP